MRTTKRSSSVLAGVALLVGLAAIGAAERAAIGTTASPSPGLQQSRPTHPVHIPRLRLGGSTATNWSGYAVDGSNITDVQGSWTVPAVDTANSYPNSYSSAWVGIDGDNSSTVEQCGTDQDYVNGHEQYYAWYEMYPKGSATLPPANYPVGKFDSIHAAVHYGGNGQFQLTLTNASRGWTFMTVQKLPQARRSSAEWIMEAPWSGGVLPLADFGTINFNGCTWSPAGGSLQPITMVDSSYTGTNLASHTKAYPTSWSSGSFSVVYQKAL
jgi:hypothetical protein